MPYVPSERRKDIETVIPANSRATGPFTVIDPDSINTIGELNFAITRLCVRYLEDHPVMSYQTFNAVVGVLECAKLEIYRRMVAPYEDVKREENGDVYTTSS